MEPAAPDGKIREVLAAIGQYLSDLIPPFQAAEPVATLMKQPVQMMASEIINWVPAQLRDGRATFADFLFHAIRKLLARWVEEGVLTVE